MSVAAYQAELSGRATGGGVNTWTFVQAQIPSSPFPPESVEAVRDALETFYVACDGFLPTSLDVTLPAEASIYNEETGQLQSVVTGSGGSTLVPGTDASSKTSRATQLKIQTRSGEIQDGRELRGGVFLGPISETALTLAGLVDPATITTVETAGAALLSTLAGDGVFMVVWRRPRPASAPGGARAGSLAIVQSISAWDQPAVLRSRRD